jgi:thiol peroxidase
MKMARWIQTALATVMTASLLLIAGCAATQMTQRTGLVRMGSMPITLEGNPIHVGEQAPAFRAVNAQMGVYHFYPGHGQVWILSSVPSIDTPVCSLETDHFNKVASTMAPDVHIITISMDLPFAQKQWCGAKGIKNITLLSDYRFHSFARHYGVLMKQNGLLARQVVVVGKDGKIVYVQLVPNIAHQPNYAPVLAAARRAAMATH